MKFKQARKIASQNGLIFEKTSQDGYQFLLKDKRQDKEIYFADMDQATPYIEEILETGMF